MGSAQPSDAAEAPQQELPPVVTLRAACPYFSFTTSLISGVLMFISLFAADNLLRLDGFISGAALGVKKAQQLFECVGVGRIPQERSFPADGHEFFVLEFFQMVGQRGTGNFKLAPNLANYHSLRMSRQQKPHDPKPRFGAHGGERSCADGNLFRGPPASCRRRFLAGGDLVAS